MRCLRSVSNYHAADGHRPTTNDSGSQSFSTVIWLQLISPLRTMDEDILLLFRMRRTYPKPSCPQSNARVLARPLTQATRSFLARYTRTSGRSAWHCASRSLVRLVVVRATLDSMHIDVSPFEPSYYATFMSPKILVHKRRSRRPRIQPPHLPVLRPAFSASPRISSRSRGAPRRNPSAPTHIMVQELR
jgi:hypothetical protein